jgi:hypothetical protein
VRVIKTSRQTARRSTSYCDVVKVCANERLNARG